jgi:hypothetical protein
VVDHTVIDGNLKKNQQSRRQSLADEEVVLGSRTRSVGYTRLVHSTQFSMAAIATSGAMDSADSRVWGTSRFKEANTGTSRVRAPLPTSPLPSPLLLPLRQRQRCPFPAPAAASCVTHGCAKGCREEVCVMTMVNATAAVQSHYSQPPSCVVALCLFFAAKLLCLFGCKIISLVQHHITVRL